MRDSKKERLERALDLFIDEALDVAENSMTETLTEPEEEIAYSEKHKEDMERIFRLAQKKEDAKRIRMYASRAACLLLIGVLAVGGMIVGVDAGRRWKWNLGEIDPSEKNTTFQFIEENGVPYENNSMQLQYVPEGYKKIQSGSIMNYAYVGFEKNDLYFAISEISDGDTGIHAENAETETAFVNGTEGEFIRTPERNFLLWYIQERHFKLEGNMPDEEMIKVAEGMKLK